MIRIQAASPDGRTYEEQRAAIEAQARRAITAIIAAWRAAGMSDAEIEAKLGRPLPAELRASPERSSVAHVDQAL